MNAGLTIYDNIHRNGSYIYTFSFNSLAESRFHNNNKIMFTLKPPSFIEFAIHVLGDLDQSLKHLLAG